MDMRRSGVYSGCSRKKIVSSARTPKAGVVLIYGDRFVRGGFCTAGFALLSNCYCLLIYATNGIFMAIWPSAMKRKLFVKRFNSVGSMKNYKRRFTAGLFFGYFRPMIKNYCIWRMFKFWILLSINKWCFRNPLKIHTKNKPLRYMALIIIDTSSLRYNIPIKIAFYFAQFRKCNNCLSIIQQLEITINQVP